MVDDMSLLRAGGVRSDAEDGSDLRDWLRVSREDRILYANVKRHLAQKQWNDNTPLSRSGRSAALGTR